MKWIADVFIEFSDTGLGSVAVPISEPPASISAWYGPLLPTLP